jgi:tetratricopeptide (TPR) repeat protein
MTDDDRLDRAKALYERAVFGGQAEALPAAERDLDGVEADLALARGRILHARFMTERREDVRELALFERAAELYQQLSDVRGTSEALFWIGIVHQVVRGHTEPAVPFFERSYALATQVGDSMTVSYAARHLGFAFAEAGEVDAARAKLEESLRLRRELDFGPGIAAALLSLAELAHRTGDQTQARALLEQADKAAASDAAAGIRRWVGELRAEIAGA